MNALMTWLGQSWLHEFMVHNPVAFIVAETLHFIGLSLLIGAILVVDLRGVGLFRNMSLVTLHKLVPVAIAGFLINLVTGIGFIAYDPSNYLGNTAFLWKMALIALAGANAVLFEVAVFRPMRAGAPDVDARIVTRASSALSLLIWAAVLVLGRLIPFA
jgi:hypothetical protein